MKFIDKRTIQLDKAANDLDKLVIRFIKILKKHTDYVIVSGYVAILLGRSRTTEDVDIFVKEMEKEKFREFYDDLQSNGFWCLNGEDADELYNYLKEGIALRFALENQTIPNFEVKFARKMLDRESFNDALTIITTLGQVKISSLERQIAFKKYFLKSDKDLEDASHIEKIFKDGIDNKRIYEYKRMIENEMAKTRQR